MWPWTPVKFSVLKVRNLSNQPRRLSATGYVEWVLGDLRPEIGLHVITEIDPTAARSSRATPYNTEFRRPHRLLRRGRSGADPERRPRRIPRAQRACWHPAAMTRTHLSGKVGPGWTPVPRSKPSSTWPPGRTHEIVFRLGVGAGAAPMTPAAWCIAAADGRRPGGAGGGAWLLDADAGRGAGGDPDPSLDVLANGWLLYQTLACRLWARSGYYQSGGAFGFRDQLQDTMALIHAEPAGARATAALRGRQFREGDVQHWWHPPSGRGVRTRCSDDYLWLPLATCRYVLATGDTGVLDETVAFLEGRPGQWRGRLLLRSARPVRRVGEPLRALRARHRARPAVRRARPAADGLRRLERRHEPGRDQGPGREHLARLLPLRGADAFAEVACLRGDEPFVERCQRRPRLRGNLEQHGWDGDWYRRAYFDDGTPLGSADNPNAGSTPSPKAGRCSPGRARPTRTHQAMGALDAHLVRRDAGLIQLLDPPFDQSDRSTPAISRATSPACARTAASTPMPPSGRPWRSRHWATDARLGTVRHDQPDQPRPSQDGSPPTRSSPM
jgi:cyclic beta-1,2-glucan synthetase